MAKADVIVVSHNSSRHLRACVEPFAERSDISVVVVDNASSDDSLAAVADLPVETIELTQNLGFAAGCNRGWTAGTAPYVLFLNPDAIISPDSVAVLVGVLERERRVGIVSPRIVNDMGQLDPSIRRFPRLRSTFAQALFLHRVFPRATWVDELVRDDPAYGHAHDVDWVSGACLLARRDLLNYLGGWDEGFFLYCEDIDLCRRTWQAGYAVRFEPQAAAIHLGGESAPRPALLPVLTASRIRYARKHASSFVAVLERTGIALGALTHLVAGRGGVAARAGHARSLRLATRGGGSPP